MSLSQCSGGRRHICFGKRVLTDFLVGFCLFFSSLCYITACGANVYIFAFFSCLIISFILLSIPGSSYIRIIYKVLSLTSPQTGKPEGGPCWVKVSSLCRFPYFRRLRSPCGFVWSGGGGACICKLQDGCVASSTYPFHFSPLRLLY